MPNYTRTRLLIAFSLYRHGDCMKADRHTCTCTHTHANRQTERKYRYIILLIHIHYITRKLHTNFIQNCINTFEAHRQYDKSVSTHVHVCAAYTTHNTQHTTHNTQTDTHTHTHTQNTHTHTLSHTHDTHTQNTHTHVAAAV